MPNKFYKLEEIADFENINNYFAATGTPTLIVNASAISLWDEADFEAIFDDQCDKSIYLKETNDPWGGFKNKWTQWLNRNKSFIANELYTLTSKYNPIHNYDKHEVHSGDDTLTKTPDEWVTTKMEEPDNWKKTVTQKPTNWQEQNVKSYTNFHDTETEMPTNWEKTTTQTPTQWQETDTESYTNYSETDTQTPTGWKKEFKGTDSQNTVGQRNKVVPFNGTDLALVSGSDTQENTNRSEEQLGTFETEKTKTGSITNTKAFTGTYQTTEEQAGTYARDRTKTGTETDTKSTTGTFATEETEEGKKIETVEQGGTFEEKTDYGHIIDVSGNIGVTTTATMIREVLDLYDADFIKRWIMRFFHEYCVYVR